MSEQSAKPPAATWLPRYARRSRSAAGTGEPAADPGGQSLVGGGLRHDLGHLRQLPPERGGVGRAYRSRAMARASASLSAGGRSERPDDSGGMSGRDTSRMSSCSFLPLERALPREPLVEGQRQRIDVAAGIDLLPSPCSGDM